MVIISMYRQEHLNDKIFIRSEEQSVCPVCTSSLSVIGSKHRKAIDHTGVKQTFVIRRLRCVKCALIHHELPDIIVPYKRHCCKAIEEVIDDVGERKRNSLRRASRLKHWWRVMRAYFSFIVQSLNFQYGTDIQLFPPLKQVVRAMINSHSWAHTRSVLEINPWMDTA